MPISKEMYDIAMNTPNSPEYPIMAWGVGRFPFEVPEVRSGSMKHDGSTPEQRAEDLVKVLPNIQAINDYLETLFPGDEQARATEVTVEGVSCKDCDGSLVEIGIPHEFGIYLSWIYSLDCGSGAQMWTE